MTKEMQRFLLLAFFLLIALAVLILLILPQIRNLLSRPQGEGYQIGFSQDMHKAEVVEILDESEVLLGDHIQTYQLVRVLVLEGPWEGLSQELEYGKAQILPEGMTLAPGNRIMINISEMPDGSLNIFFVDFVRTSSLLWLLLAFVALSVLVGGKQGVRGLLGLLLSLIVILGFIIPSILQGKDPTVVSVLGGFLLITITLYLIYGFELKTHAAVLGMFFTLIFAGLMIGFFINLSRMTGFGNEEALYIMQQSEIHIDLRGLVLAGMLIGALGALDDLVITQASVVFQLHATDSSLNFRNLYRSAMRVGEDHVSAMINTLFMAYAGAALPTLVLFSLSQESFTNLINLEFVAEEVVRMLAGSLGLIAAAPIATAIASLLAVNRDRLRIVPEFLKEEKRPEDE
ncbi:MAG TPA: YibE/F family protein [Anaerolineae bacterium]|nr:YibE/F family protein [Anaerolineae bacterium]